MQFQDKFSSSRQVNSPKNQNFEYVVSGKVLANFACCFFVLISRHFVDLSEFRDYAAAREIRRPDGNAPCCTSWEVMLM